MSPPDPAWRDVPAEDPARDRGRRGDGRRNASSSVRPCRIHGSATSSSNSASCGYRPLRIRPYRRWSSVLVAAVWTRDGRSWQWLGEADAERLRSRDADLRREGYVPIDVSVTCRGGWVTASLHGRLGASRCRGYGGPSDRRAPRRAGTAGAGGPGRGEIQLPDRQVSSSTTRGSLTVQPVDPAEGPAEVHHAAVPWPCR